MSDWVRYVAEKLPELGYTRIEPCAFYVNGGFIIDKHNTHLIEFVGEDLFDMAVTINEEKKKNFYGKTSP